MAVLLAGCYRTQKEDQGSSQQTSEPTTGVTLVSRCADNASAVGSQEEASGGEVSNGKIAFLRYPARASANKDIYVIDEEGTHETRLTHTTQLVELNPLWSPDGKKIAFTRGQGGLYMMNADGTNQTQLAEHADYLPFAWSPDGQKIAFKERGFLYVINADRTNKARLATSFSRNAEYKTVLGTPVWSPLLSMNVSFIRPSPCVSSAPRS
jgi:Tol biopolymer transport system component